MNKWASAMRESMLDHMQVTLGEFDDIIAAIGTLIENLIGAIEGLAAKILELATKGADLVTKFLDWLGGLFG